MKKSFLLILCSFYFLSCYAIIYRSDKPISLYHDLAMQPQFNCVGIFYVGKDVEGTCVLIKDRYVLTAAHCVVGESYYDTTIVDNGRKLVVHQPVKENIIKARCYVEFNGVKYEVETILIHPAYLNEVTKNKCDIAILKLKKPVENISKAILCNQYNELHDTLYAVGYGAHGPANQPDKVKSTTMKLAGQNMIDSIGGYMLNGIGTFLMCDFDKAGNNDCNIFGNSIPLQLECITSGGDSGGGAFRKTSKGWELIGICGGIEHGGVNIKTLMTKGKGYYCQTMEYMRVSAFNSWIEESTKQ